MEANRGSARSGLWRWYLVAVGLAVGAIVAVNAGMGVDEAGSSVVPRSPAVHVSSGLVSFLVVLTFAGCVGLGLAIAFLATHGRFRTARRPRIQPQVLLICFLVYLAAHLTLSGFAAAALFMLGFDIDTTTGATTQLAGQMLAVLGALAVGLSTLRWLTSYTLEDPREIGLRVGRVGRAAAWGVGGYCAALPFMVAGLIVSRWLSGVLFRHLPAPEHPIVPILLKGGEAFAAAMVLAVIVAPIVEEIFFRGMLYNALRGVMGVWGAAVLSGAIFAIVHPTMPVGFLPILALGVVLASLRETTGSLVPCMICHALNNAVALSLARLIY